MLQFACQQDNSKIIHASFQGQYNLGAWNYFFRGGSGAKLFTFYPYQSN